ncbi:MAG: polysaccharide deacetylase family protein [Rhodocyclaceae bacterium]
MKAFVRWLVWQSGLLALYHRLRNRRSLTIAQFHRVLPAGSEEWKHSEQEYALTREEFALCLQFFRKHYNVVSLSQVLAAGQGQEALPDRALLISFDDGWCDNRTHAEPLLRQHGMRATMFVNVEAMQQTDKRWWQDALVEIFAGGRAAEALPQLGSAPRFYDAIVHMLETPLDERLGKLQNALRYVPTERQMLTAAELATLDRDVWDIGSHARTHAPLTFLTDPREELGSAAAQIAAWIGQTVACIAFPHGRYSAEIVGQCHADGLAVMSSDARLNHADALPLVMGRINIDPGVVGRSKAAAARELAYTLMRRDFQA